MPTLKQTLVSHWPAQEDPQRYAALWITLQTSFHIEGTIRSVVEEVAKNKNLSEVGRLEKVRERLFAEFAPKLHRLRKANEVADAAVAARKARLQVQKHDPADAAGAVMRAEIRTMLRNMDQSDREGLLKSDVDESLLVAIVEAPNILSGIDGKMRDHVQSTLLKRRHPNELAEIENIKQAAAMARAATTVAMDAARAAGEFNNERALHDFIDKAVAQQRQILDRDVESDFRSMSQPVAA